MGYTGGLPTGRGGRAGGWVVVVVGAGFYRYKDTDVQIQGRNLYEYKDTDLMIRYAMRGNAKSVQIYR